VGTKRRSIITEGEPMRDINFEPRFRVYRVYNGIRWNCDNPHAVYNMFPGAVEALDQSEQGDFDVYDDVGPTLYFSSSRSPLGQDLCWMNGQWVQAPDEGGR
jgi:hypothetical protein